MYASHSAVPGNIIGTKHPTSAGRRGNGIVAPTRRPSLSSDRMGPVVTHNSRKLAKTWGASTKFLGNWRFRSPEYSARLDSNPGGVKVWGVKIVISVT